MQDRDCWHLSISSASWLILAMRAGLTSSSRVIFKQGNIDACQGDGPSSQREECLTRQIQMENSENPIFPIIFHAKSPFELEYIKSCERENSLKLPEEEVVITTRSEQHIASDDECFNVDLYMDNLSTNQFGRLLIWSPRLSSTHTLLSKNFYAFPVGTICVADIQLQGKGMEF